MKLAMDLDRMLLVAALTLGTVLLVLGAYFGYTVYLDRQSAAEASPAGRVVKVIREQVKKAPNNATLRVRYGEALAAAGRHQEAIKQFNAALKIDPEHTGAYLDLAEVALSRERFEEAVTYLNKVLELTEGGEYENLNDRREIALFQLGRIALKDRKYENAAGYFKEALRIRNDASDTYYYLARALDGMGETEGAMKQVENALAFDPNFAQARFFLAELYMHEGDRINASYNYAKAAEIEPDAKEPAEALEQFGTVEELMKAAQAHMNSEPDKALESILIARNLDDDNAGAAKLHGEILVAQKKYRDALDVYRQARALAPKDQVITKAIKDLEGRLKK